ncbi:MAG: hypothetical protein Q4A37_01710 [Candidatus Saccharibacteria bacterium]|nr:hypothetical protein [Candidatus Saccharibacteria bacterium]
MTRKQSAEARQSEQPAAPAKSRRPIGLIVAVAVLSLAVIGLLAYVVVDKVVVQQDARSRVVESAPPKPDEAPDAERGPDHRRKSVPSDAGYVDYRKNGNGTGKMLDEADDVDEITGFAELKTFLRSKVGEEVMGVKIAPVVDRVAGPYAVVQGLTNAYVIVGPKDGTGPIGIVAGTQQDGMKCDDLRKAKVPGVLVDNKCFDGSGMVPYSS